MINILTFVVIISTGYPGPPNGSLDILTIFNFPLQLHSFRNFKCRNAIWRVSCLPKWPFLS